MIIKFKFCFLSFIGRRYVGFVKVSRTLVEQYIRDIQELAQIGVQ